MEKLRKQFLFRTHFCALDFDGNFVTSLLLQLIMMRGGASVELLKLHNIFSQKIS